jgi:nucleotide-binding universal stress UspA family protein
MRKVLIPTDFSPVSKNALVYGLNLYKNSDTEFEIIHIYHPAFDPVQPEILESSLGLETVKNEIMEGFVNSVSKLAEENNVLLESRIEIGLTVEKIVELSRDYELIIMGSTGINSLISQIFGGISSEVASKSKCPVLLVPTSVNYKRLNNIIYSYDYDGIDDAVLNDVGGFTKRYNAKIHFVHIYNKEKKSINIVLPHNFDIDHTISIVQADSVREGLSKYIEENEIDIVIMATKTKNFWEKIINRSHTRQFSLTTKIPLLVYHEK